MQDPTISYKASNALSRIWMKVPLLIRSIILGFGINTLGVGIWVLIFAQVDVPWSILLMSVVLFLYWKYFAGEWGPKSTQAFRRRCFRQISLDVSVWRWASSAAICAFLVIAVGWALTFRLVEFQPEIFKNARFLNDYSPWNAWSIILMASLVAGICEEIGFRGYIQVPLESKYGPLIGISITSMIFAVAHLHQAWATGAFVGIFAISFMLGYLAYSTNSLLPGILSHVSFDIVNFSYWWSDVMGTFNHKPIQMTGVDQHFIMVLAVVVISTIVFIISIVKILSNK